GAHGPAARLRPLARRSLRLGSAGGPPALAPAPFGGGGGDGALARARFSDGDTGARSRSLRRRGRRARSGDGIGGARLRSLRRRCGALAPARFGDGDRGRSLRSLRSRVAHSRSLRRPGHGRSLPLASATGTGAARFARSGDGALASLRRRRRSLPLASATGIARSARSGDGDARFARSAGEVAALARMSPTPTRVQTLLFQPLPHGARPRSVEPAAWRSSREIVDEVIPLAADQDAAQLEDELGAFAPPAHSGTVQAHGDDVDVA